MASSRLPVSMPPQHLAGAEAAVAWLLACGANAATAALRTDSRQVQPGDVFLAWPGARHDGRLHVQAALQAGAVACLVEAHDLSAARGAPAAFTVDSSSGRVAAVAGLKAAAGTIAHCWNDRPSQHLRVLAVTGTNGKTSTSWWLAQALAARGTRCGVAGTLGMGEWPAAGGAAAALRSLQATGLTTPDAVALHAGLRALRSRGVQACALEASSIGLEEHRLQALQIEVALFTNLTQDHLDYHGTMAAYWAAKQRLFAWPGLQAAVVNVDDAHGRELAHSLAHASAQQAAPQLWTVSLDVDSARLRGLNLRYDSAGLVLDVHEPGASGQTCVTVRSPLVGRFNASNLMVVLGGLRALGVPLPDAAAAVAQLTPVPGRMQRVEAAGAAAAETEAAADVQVIVDYAHTPDALHQVLHALAPLAAARQGRLWCVVGCGGDRDNSKRPLMGAAAAQGAHHVVLTSDNPRSEDPARILQHMRAGISDSAALQRLTVIQDRRTAIAHAVANAAPGDVVLLAGKGHETTQEVAGEKRPFSDADEARAALMVRAASLRPVAPAPGAAC
jgi:UDP-N-acetylmuramyl-tripeptide synthetase